MNAKRRAQLSRLHVRMGILFALPLLLLGVSGILLGFYDELRHSDFPDRLDVRFARPLSPAVLAEAARAAWPFGPLEVLHLPAAPDRAVRAAMAGEQRVTLFLHPGTGELLAIRDTERKDWVGRLHDLHRGKVAGFAGEIVAAAAALAIVILWLTGLALRRRRKGARHLHARLGVAAGGILAFLAFTGGVLAFAKPLRDAFYPPPRVGSVITEYPEDLSRLITRGTAVSPAAPLDRIIFQLRSHQPLVLRFRDGGRVWLDGGSGEVLRTETPFSPWINLLYPLHSGRILGGWGPPLAAAFGALLLFLAGSGWLLRRPGGKISR